MYGRNTISRNGYLGFTTFRHDYKAILDLFLILTKINLQRIYRGYLNQHQHQIPLSFSIWNTSEIRHSMKFTLQHTIKFINIPRSENKFIFNIQQQFALNLPLISTPTSRVSNAHLVHATLTYFQCIFTPKWKHTSQSDYIFVNSVVSVK
jgi:hypothetical protein